LDNSQDAVFGLKDLVFTYVNPTAAKLLGYDSPDELIGRDSVEFVHPGYKQIIRERSEARQKGLNPPTKYEVKLLRRDGTAVDVELHVAITEVDGEPLTVTYARNIEERIRHRSNLKALHRHITELATAETVEEIIALTLDAMSQALEFEFSSVLKVEDDKLVMYTNKPGYSGYSIPLNGKGLTVQAAKTQKTIMVEDTRDAPNYLKGSEKSLSELDVPVIIEEKTVAVLNVEKDTVAAFNEDHKTLLETLASHVGTAFYRLEKEKQLEEMTKRHIRELVKNYQRISSTVRHDLRAPLQAIYNASEILSVEPDNKKMRDLIRSQSRYIESILDDWNKQTLSGKIERKMENLLQLVQVAVKGVVTQESIDIRFEIDEDLNFNLDYNRMMRALSNIIRNSQEAMPNGGTITIAASLKDGNLLLEVIDTGIGISEEDMDFVYDPFFTTKQKGMGLGLAFVRQVVEAHNGTVKITSKLGEGTRISIRIPPES
jgi:PAS domain S-box-containing protein